MLIERPISIFSRCAVAVAALVAAAPAVRAEEASAGAVEASSLTDDDVRTILARAVAAAQAEGIKATIAVTDREANLRGLFLMNGTSPATKAVGGTARPCKLELTALEGCDVSSTAAAVSKAGTAAFFQTRGNAFTPRTASFIVQQHFPPSVERQPGGPLFGVQFSSMPCTDITVKPGTPFGRGTLPLGLSPDAGGAPLYKGGEPVGGVGVEADGVYTADFTPQDPDRPGTAEERVAFAASAGFEAPAEIQATEIIVNGIRFPYADGLPARTFDAKPLESLDGIFQINPAVPSRFKAKTVGGVNGVVLVDPDTTVERFPTRPGKDPAGLTAADVDLIITQAAQTAMATRAAIRRPLASHAAVSITVVDVDGSVLGFFRVDDAPIFGVDVSAQKARTAAFFSSARAGTALRAAGYGKYVDAAKADGLNMDGSFAFSDRGNGFLSRPFFPDGIDSNPNGPFSRPIPDWTIFNDGLQSDLLIGTDPLGRPFLRITTPPCTGVPGLENGIQIFAGSVPLFKNGVLAGAIGISGDGIDQDDFIATNGSRGFEAPLDKRCDRVMVRGVRLPFVKFPRHPLL